MRIAYIECFSGISGDMFLGALVDAGVSPRLLEDAVAALNIGASLRISRVVRSGISATKVDVLVNGEDGARALPPADSNPGHIHSHEEHHPGHDHHEGASSPEGSRAA